MKKLNRRVVVVFFIQSGFCAWLPNILILKSSSVCPSASPKCLEFASGATYGGSVPLKIPLLSKDLHDDIILSCIPPRWGNPFLEKSHCNLPLFSHCWRKDNSTSLSLAVNCWPLGDISIMLILISILNFLILFVLKKFVSHFECSPKQKGRYYWSTVNAQQLFLWGKAAALSRKALSTVCLLACHVAPSQITEHSSIYFWVNTDKFAL